MRSSLKDPDGKHHVPAVWIDLSVERTKSMTVDAEWQSDPYPASLHRADESRWYGRPSERTE